MLIAGLEASLPIVQLMNCLVWFSRAWQGKRSMNYRKMRFAVGAAALIAFAGARAESTPGKNVAPAPAASLSMMASAVPCSDLERSIAFYTKGLGMTLGGRIEMGSVTEVPLMFPGAGTYLILLKPKAEGAPVPARGPLSRIILSVPDLKALETQLTAAGYHLDAPIAEQPKYHVAVGQLKDPDGNQLELVQRTP
jgi:catechol 2,3-dioxygenase-like lactoylglutathione lyase family enzyme